MAGTPVRDVHTQTHMYIQYTSPHTRPHIWQVRRSGTCTYRHTCTVHIPAYKTAHTAGTPVRDVHTQTHMYIQYTSPPTRPHIWHVRRSGTCTHRHTCTVHIPAYKTAHTAGTPVRDVHTQTHMSGADTGGGAMGALAPPSRKWAGLQCAHAQRHVITIGLYTLNRCFWRVFRAATDQGRI